MFEKIKNWKQKLGKWFWVLLLLLIIVIWKMFFGRAKPVVYPSAKVTKGELLETVSTTGRVKADQYANLTFPSGGKIAWVSVKKGDKIKKGQAIAGLDTVILNAAYQQSVNTYKSYQAAAESALDSVKGHSGDETFAQKATRTAAEVARDNSYESMLAATQNLKYANIYSPFDGIVAEVNPTFPGAFVTAVSPASYIVVNPLTTYFESEISETDLPKIKVGQKVKINLDTYPDQTIDAEIVNIGVLAFTSSTGGNAYSLRLTLPENKESKFKVGMEGDADIILETITDVIKVPTTAIVNDEEKNYVWYYDSGKIVKKEVVIGGNSDAETEIKSGINVGDVIISEPSNKFKDGQKVAI